MICCDCTGRECLDKQATLEAESAAQVVVVSMESTGPPSDTSHLIPNRLPL